MPFSHIELMIVRGVPPAPSDPNSAEAAMLTLDLLDSTGLAVAVDGWSPNIPALKNGGTWVESQISDGRQLLATAVGDVTETMQLVMGNMDMAQRYAIAKRLGQLRQSAWDFAEGFQIDPVYIQWRASCGAGTQYALIKTFDFAYSMDSFTSNSWEVTLTITREPYWRGLWPGANPLEWTFSEQGKVRGSAAVTGYDYQDMSLIANTNHLVYDTFESREEWADTNCVTKASKSYITIPAASIPGDAPALVCMSVATPSGQDSKRLFVGRDTKELTNRQRNGTIRSKAYRLNAGDAEVANLTKTTNNASGVLNASGTRQDARNTTLGTGVTGTAKWGTGSATNLYHPDMELFRGQVAFFARVVATGGSNGDIKAKVRIAESFIDTTNYVLEGDEYPVSNRASTNQYELVYLGTFQIPFSTESVSDVDGRGVKISPNTRAGNLYVEVQLRNSAGSNRAVYLVDLVVIPVDEMLIEMNVFTNTVFTFILDNTGYFNHGNEGMVAKGYYAADDWIFSIECKGEDLTLIPGVDNRLFFVYNYEDSTPVEVSQTYDSGTDIFLTARLNIIPRWVGIRDT